MLGALAGAVVERLDHALKTHPNQNDSAAAALNLIALYEGCSNGQLSAGLKLSHAATVRLVDKLEADGLVESRYGEDRRSVALFLTAAGQERVRTILEGRCVVLGDIVDLLSSPQQEQLSAIVEALLERLTTTPIEGGHICRLCDDIVCPGAICPVHQRAEALTRAS